MTTPTPVAPEGARDVDDAGPQRGDARSPDDAAADASPPSAVDAGPVVHVGDVVVRTDADARALRGVTVIDGELRLEGAELTSVRDLEALHEVRSLVVRGNAVLASLAGLEGLTTITGDLVVEENAALTSLDALTSLAAVEGALRIGNTQVAVLDPTTKAYKGVTPVADNGALASVTLPSLDHVRSLEILRNPALTSVAFGKLRAVAGPLEISYSPKIASLQDSFRNVETIAGAVTIGRNRTLFSVTDDAGTRAVSVPTTGNDALAKVDFPHLTLSSDIATFENPKLAELNLPKLGTMDGSLRTNAPLVDIRLLATVSGAVELYATQTLISPSLNRLGALTLTNTHMPALGPLSALSRVGDLTILSSDLTSLRGLEHLAYANGITISRSPQLTSTDGLDGLVEIADALVIHANRTLVDVHLPSLAHAYDISISSNPALTSVRLDALARPLDSLAIDACPALATVHAPAVAAISSFSIVGRGSRITTLDLDALRSLDGLHLEDGPASLAPFLALTQLGSLYVRTRHLPQTDLDAFVAALAAKGVVPTDVDVRYSAPPH